MTPAILEPPELDLLTPRWQRGLRDERYPRRIRLSVLASVLLHLAAFPLLPYLPWGEAPNYEGTSVRLIDLRNATPLIAPVLPKPELPPPTELTQKAPNTGRPSSEVSMADLLPRPAVPQASAPAIPSASPAPSPELIEPPKIETPSAGTPPPPPPQVQPLAQPQIQPVEKPRNPFERVGPSMNTSAGPKVDIPRPTVQDALREAQHGGGHLTVGDPGEGGAGEVMGQVPRARRSGSAVELLSDPLGVDFKPYLIQVLAAVRRNWFAVWPESVRLGQRGRVVLVFSIVRTGRVGKLVIGAESGAAALDRAAVASISMSDPFPPLPAEFHGGEIQLRMAFSYNMPAR